MKLGTALVWGDRVPPCLSESAQSATFPQRIQSASYFTNVVMEVVIAPSSHFNNSIRCQNNFIELTQRVSLDLNQ